MGELFIEVRKVTSKVKEAEDGTKVKDPGSRKPVQEKVHQINVESIRIDQIRSFRVWGKTQEQETQIDGDCVKIYMIGNGLRDKQPEMIIQESYSEFADRLRTIRTNG